MPDSAEKKISTDLPGEETEKKAPGRKKLWAVVFVFALLVAGAAIVGLLVLDRAINEISYDVETVGDANAEAVEPVWIDPAYAAGQGIYFPEKEPVQRPEIFNVLLLGTDYSISEKDPGRADTNMLCSINTETGDVKLVSFERGIGVPVPGRGSDILTHAYTWGGPGLSQGIISQMFAVDVRGYVRVNFYDFINIIDAVGGVDVELTAQEAEALNRSVSYNDWGTVEVHEGWNHLDGHYALWYSRLRAIDSDWNRQGRQRTVLMQVQEVCRDMSVIELMKLADSILPMIHTNLSREDVLVILRSLPKLAKGTVSQLQVPDKNYRDNYIRCIPDYEAKKIDNFLYNAGYEITSPY
ncbi:MAG: LCP family protein [Abditibacteriota bacterium]|nr:LCP family protein [Abditibacteriota bacterium]